MTAEERQETEQMVKDEQLRRTNPKAYEKVREQRQAEQAREQMQLPNQRLPINDGGLSSTAPTTSGLPTYMSPYTTMAESTHFERPEPMTVAMDSALIRAQIQELSTTHTLSLTPNINSNLSSIEPVLGARTRVVENNASRSPEREDSLIPPQHSPPQQQVASAELGEGLVLSNLDKATELNTRSAVTPSSASPTGSEPVTDGLRPINHGLKEVARKEAIASIAPVIAEHVAKGTFIQWVGQHVNEALASSIIRHADRTTTNENEYWESVRDAVRNILARGDTSDALVAEAHRKVKLKLSKKLEAIASNTVPDEGSNGRGGDQIQSLAEKDGVNRDLSPTPAKEGKRVGARIRLPLLLPPTFSQSQYPSLAGLLDREANRNRG